MMSRVACGVDSSETSMSASAPAHSPPGLPVSAPRGPVLTRAEDAVGFVGGYSQAYAALTLVVRGGGPPAEAVEGLQQSAETAAFLMATAAAADVPQQSDWSGCLEELTGPRWRAVRRMKIMRGWNLPATWADCRAYASLDPADGRCSPDGGSQRRRTRTRQRSRQMP